MKQKKSSGSHPVGNRTVVGIICIVVALAICFGIAPLVNRLSDGKTEIVRLIKDVPAGATINETDIEVVEVGSYNLPSNVITDKTQVVGKCALVNLSVGDYVLPSKVGDDLNNAQSILESLDSKHKAISITIGSFALGLSGYSHESANHNNLSSALTVREILLASGVASDSTKFILSHIPSGKKNPTHDEICEAIKELPFTVAYDGYFLGI